MKLRRFQKKFIARAFAPGIDTSALSLPRGNGKSWLAGHLLARFLTPGDPLHVRGKEAVLLSGSIEQSRIVFKFCREVLEPTGEYSFIDSATRVGITHRKTRTRLRVHGSNSKTALGLVNVPIVVWDEPGAATTIGGQALWDAVATSQGKPNSTLRAILIGTVAPSSSGWWAEMLAAGSQGTVYVQALQGDVKTWDKWATIRKANPLTSISSTFRAKLIDERDQARRDSRLKARFLSFRLNVPTPSENDVLLTVDDFEGMTKREVPARVGRPIVGVDLGGSRAWSAAIALYENGRIECRAVCPGLPSIEDQERRDRVPRGTYQILADQGVLVQSTGLRVPPPKVLVNLITSTWGRPASLICDRFRLDELRDAQVPCRVHPRITRWSEASYDIRALRARVKDGPFSIDPSSKSMMAASLAAASVQNDDAGSCRLVKRGTNNTGRDDVAAAFTLAAGAYERSRERGASGGLRHVIVS